MRFSERMRLSKPKMMQLYDMDDDLRNGLWNALYVPYLKPRTNHTDELLSHIWGLFLKKPLDSIPKNFGYNNTYIKIDWLKEIYLQGTWHIVYDLVEFIYKDTLRNEANGWTNEMNVVLINDILKKEFSGYRLINGLITPITSQEEIETIEEALESDHDQVKAHIQKALELLSDRKNPDYRNSIKESISAVEAICRNITGENTLGKALNKINSRITLNQQLKDGLEKIIRLHKQRRWNQAFIDG
jgi:hypothetical protein